MNCRSCPCSWTFLHVHCQAAHVATQQVAAVFSPLLCSVPRSPRSPGPCNPSSPSQQAATTAVSLLIEHQEHLFIEPGEGAELPSNGRQACAALAAE